MCPLQLDTEWPNLGKQHNMFLMGTMDSLHYGTPVSGNVYPGGGPYTIQDKGAFIWHLEVNSTDGGHTASVTDLPGWQQ